MNWRRGLLRLWLVLSLCWIVALGVFAWEQAPWKAFRMAACEEAGGNPIDCYDAERARPEAPVGLSDIAAVGKRWGKELAVFALLPPLITLVLGLLGVWVVSGFAHSGT
jgi:hypothetical protein